jgi:hypothetical protein
MLYLHLFLVALIGFLLHTLIKLRSLSQKAKVGNIPFSVWQYFRDDSLSVAISLTSIVLAVYAADEIIGWHESLEGKSKVLFAFYGYVSNDIVSKVFGSYSKIMDRVIDKKTNIADGIDHNESIR